MTPHYFQRNAIDALYAWFQANRAGNPLLELPTGSGKSVVIALLIKEALQNWPRTRILVLTHVKELIEQNAKRVRQVWPGAPVGVYSSGLRCRDTTHPVIFAGIQSVADKALHLGWFDLILVDECHMISHKAQGQYWKFFAGARSINPHVRIVGLTATPFRTGHGSLLHGDHALFTDTAYSIPMLELVNGGYLAPLTSQKTRLQLDVEGITTRNGDFAPGELESRINHEEIIRDAILESMACAAGRKAWLVFTAGVAHAEATARIMTQMGISSGCVTGKTPRAQRDQAIAQYCAGRLQALVTVGVLTTGFDAPMTDVLVMLRPTKSPVLYVQMCGRGTRVFPGKDNCLVLDFAGNAERHGPVDQVKAWVPRPKEGASAPFKVCPECAAHCAPMAATCAMCGYEFPPVLDKPKHGTDASDAPIMSTDGRATETRDVARVYYNLHQSVGKRPSLRVDYFSLIDKIASEWIFLEHDGFPREKAVRWWVRRCNVAPPKSIKEAIDLGLDNLLLKPSTVTVLKSSKYPEVIGYGFA